MRSLYLVALTTALVHCAVVPKHLEPHHVDKKTSVEEQINEALKDIEESRKIIRMTVTMNDTSDDESPASFFRNIEDTFSGMMASLHNVDIPYFSRHSEEPVETPKNKEDKTDRDLITRTREELKNDVAALESYVSRVRAEFDEWVMSNRHQEVKSMMLGALSAVVVLVVYFAVSKWCRRRSRLTHLAAFANEGFSRHDTEGLLPTKHKVRPQSNSDEDI